MKKNHANAIFQITILPVKIKNILDFKLGTCLYFKFIIVLDVLRQIVKNYKLSAN